MIQLYQLTIRQSRFISHKLVIGQTTVPPPHLTRRILDPLLYKAFLIVAVQASVPSCNDKGCLLWQMCFYGDGTFTNVICN